MRPRARRKASTQEFESSSRNFNAKLLAMLRTDGSRELHQIVLDSLAYEYQGLEEFAISAIMLIGDLESEVQHNQLSNVVHILNALVGVGYAQSKQVVTYKKGRVIKSETFYRRIARCNMLGI